LLIFLCTRCLSMCTPTFSVPFEPGNTLSWSGGFFLLVCLFVCFE
jgi:hypothetical protein